MDKLILASRSPRRCELLSRLGIPFETFVPDVDESCALPAEEAVAELSRRKALATASGCSGAFILAADTLVAAEGKVLGKPLDYADAARMLHLLSGRRHHVYTGVTVVSPGGELFSETDQTAVTFCDIPEGEIMEYLNTDEPFDKAGSYALQGRASFWVTRLEGSDTSVIGLPLYLVRDLLLKAGFPLLKMLKRN